MGRWLRNTLISVAIGGAFLYVAVRDWNWADIKDSLRPLPSDAVWLTVELAGPLTTPATVHLTRAGVALPVIELAAGPAGVRSMTVDLSTQESAEGWWTAKTDAAIRNWSLDFRSPEDRAARNRPGDPWVFSAPPGRPVRVRGLDWFWVLPYLAAFVVIHFARIARFGALLRPLAQLSAWRLFVVGSVGYMAIIILPLRLGEFVRPYLVTEDGASFSGALGACVVERVLDGLAVCGLLFGSVFLAAAAGVQVPAGVWVAGGAALVLFTSTLFVLLFANWRREATLKVLRRIGEPISKKLTDKALGLVDSFIDGVAVLPNRRLILATFALTALYWAANVFGHWCLLQAAGVVSPTGQDLGMVEAAAIMSILAIGIILPAGPGFAGNFEAAARVGMSLFVTTEVLLTRGAAWTLLIHSITLLLQTGIGLSLLATGQVSLARALRADPASPDNP